MTAPIPFNGRIETEGSPGWDAARSMYNSSIRADPSAIFYCSTENDVRIALSKASDMGSQVAVRSTGHSVSGSSIADAAVLIDLSSMRGVDHFPERRIRCQGGATWWDFDHVSSRVGLAVTGGTVSSTGVGGLTLGGGIGWLLPTAGLACDSLVSARVVMADGGVAHVSDTTDHEFIRCLRGLGHGLAVVTEFEFECHPLEPILAGSILVDLRRVSASFVERVCTLLNNPPRSLMLSPSFIYRDSAPLMSVDLAVHGATASHELVVDDLLTHEDVVLSTTRVRDYLSLQTMLDSPSRRGLRAHWTHRYLNSVDPPLLGTIAEAFQSAPSQHCIIFLEHMHGAFLKPHRDSAFPARGERFSVLITASWEQEAADAANRQWLREVERAIGPWASSSAPYRNYMSTNSADVLQTPTAFANLKSRVDPHNVFVDPRFCTLRLDA